jgi:hypothetical protein
MSAEAVAWASDQLPPKGRAKELLRLMASFADAGGEAWAAIGTLGEEMQLADRSVQYLLRALEAGGFIVRTGRVHHRNVPYYQLALDRPGALAEVRAARRVARRTPGPRPANGAKDCTVQAPNGAKDCTPNGATHCTRYSRYKNSGAYAPSTGARAAEDQVLFEALFGAWVDACPGRVSRTLAAPAFDAAAARVDPARIVAAAVRYLAEDEPARRLGPLALHRWLTEDRWEPWLGDPVRGGPLAAWAGPAAIRAFAVAERGEAWTASWLDRAAWDGERRAIVARTSIAVDRLGEVLARAGLGIEIIEKGRSS